MPHRRQQTLLVFDLFLPAKNRAINFGENAMQCRNPTPTTAQPSFDPLPNFGIEQHVVIITDGQSTIACTYICEKQSIQIRCILPHTIRHRKWRWIAKLGPRHEAGFGYCDRNCHQTSMGDNNCRRTSNLGTGSTCRRFLYGCILCLPIEGTSSECPS